MDSCKTISFSITKNKSFKLSRAIYWILVVFFFCGNSGVMAQGNQSSNVSLDVNNVTISTALVQLAVVADFNFSFNSDNQELNRKITYSAVDRPPLAILEDLLDGTGHQFKIIGKQVVIFKEEEKEPEEQQVIVTPTPTVITRYVPKPVYDTIYITDTVYQILTDTILEIDTVFIEKEKEKKPVNKLKDIPIDYFNQKSSRESGWAIGFSLAPIATDFSMVRQESKISVRSFSLGVELSKIAKNWMFKGGVKFTNFAEKFNHNYMVQEGGFFVVDTVDEYYTVSQGDTSFFYVTDSSWKPIDIREYNYNINNRIGMLELGFSVSYDFYTNDYVRFYVVAGGQVGILVYKNGLAIPYPDQPEGVDFAELTFTNQSYSILAGAGMKYRISKGMDFNTEVNYIKYINNLVVDYPENTMINGLSLKLGLLFYF